MKKIYASLFVVALALGMASCNNGNPTNASEAQAAAAGQGQEIKLDLQQSSIEFIGSGIGKEHPGTFRLKDGSVTVKDNKITGGKLIIDIKSLQVSQPEEIYQTMLLPHLLSADFFDAEKFPEATFEITQVSTPQATENQSEANTVNISGNLTLKGITKNVTFPAVVKAAENTVKGRGEFEIDRTQWEMHYGNNKQLADKFISPIVKISFSFFGGKK